jgi:hypothetical protein
VIVARFEGPALHKPTNEDVLAYKKYALPEAPGSDVTVRAASVAPEDVKVPEVSDEAARESRKLKVGHTMFGMSTPVVEVSEEEEEPEPERAPAKARTNSTPPPVFDLANEPVDIPTTGWPPQYVGMAVLCALVLVAVTGFMLLR